MAPVLNINLKCFMPIFTNEMVSSLPGNTKHIIYKLGNTILSSVYNTVAGSFTNGYLVEHIKCNWAGIFNHLAKVHNDLSVVTQQCTEIKIPIKSIVTYGNSTSVILEEGKHLLQNVSLVELKECTTTEGEAILQEHNTKMLVNNLRDILNHLEITLNNAQAVGENIFNLLNIPVKFTTDNLKIILEDFNITLDDISPREVGKNILDLINKPFTEATTPTTTTASPNDDTNGNESWGYVIGAVGFIAASLMLAKYGWDWYKERTNNKEFAQLEYGNLKYQILNSNKDILDTIFKIKDLDDIIKMLDKLENTDWCTRINNKSIITLTSQDYDLVGLKTTMENLNQEFKNLNSLDKIFSNICSLGKILNNIYSFIKPSVNNCLTNNPIIPYKITIKTFEEILQSIRNLENNKISIKEQFPLYEDSFQQLFSMLPIENTYAEYTHEDTFLIGESSSGV
ncbi:tRNA modification GTPase TrmE [Rickettsia canadensis str. McKiel]|uniref:tRNA modification GTPase TrmE n=1 Tax=Rickettsia canadensis (strain McKiel) TaxID=293613 RepID=A8EZW0_RICCK|nr:DUF5460 family protein [Rickettsia canadensis]ABV73893.1 tRNA modification GTPase TrmE [Rickettsia canadensis str. McKiel]